MQFKSEENEDEIMADINVVPLIDVMLVLLIVFMVTSSMGLESGLDVELPAAKSQMAGESDDVKAVIITLTGAGKLAVQGREVNREELSSRISEALKAEGTELVVFEGDRQATYGLAVEVMDVAKAAGAKRFAILAESQEGESSP